MIRDQFLLDISPELIIDNFAGGGGASCGIELALDIAMLPLQLVKMVGKRHDWGSLS